MSSENKEFYDLLNTITQEQTFSLELINGEAIQCKELTTSQLKDLVKAVVDSPVTQAVFNTTASRVFESSIVSSAQSPLTTLDRTLFILQTRVNSLSPTITITSGDKQVTADLTKIISDVKNTIKENSSLFETKTTTVGKLALTFGPPLLTAEQQMNADYYKVNEEIDVQNVEELRKLIGEAFINEIAKTLRTLTIEEKTLDFSSVTFKSRIKTIESLPAAAVQEVIKYIETYKKLIDDCFVVDGVTVPVDGSLFSLR